MKFIIGKKIGMTQVFKADGTVVPVTRIQAGPCVVTQVKPGAVQIGFGTQKSFRLSKAERGHLKGISLGNDPQTTVRFLKDFSSGEQTFSKGDRFSVGIFTPGEKIQVTGTSKGRGFQGVVKRHGFAGGPASHGHKDNLRMPGSIGAGGVQRVFKNMRMGGHMGDDQVTVKNLEVIEVRPEAHEILIKGAVPGARNGLLFISTADGSITIEQSTPAVEHTPVAEPVGDVAPVAEALTA
jgi:large subunit ribosomal protein L3